MKYAMKNYWKNIKLYMSFPQVWLFLSILVFAAIALVLSFSIRESTTSSLFSNIFAGLITGLVLSGLSGAKQIYLASQLQQAEWIRQLQQKIADYHKMRTGFLSNNLQGLVIEDYIYDMGAHASWVKDFILQSSFDRRLSFNTINYCKRNYGFDFDKFTEESEKLHDELMVFSCTDKRIAIDLFTEIDRFLNALYSKTITDLRDIETKVSAAQRSII